MSSWTYSWYLRQRDKGWFKGKPWEELLALNSFDWEMLLPSEQKLLSKRRKFLESAHFTPTRRQKEVGVRRGRVDRETEDHYRTLEVIDKLHTLMNRSINTEYPEDEDTMEAEWRIGGHWEALNNRETLEDLPWG